MSNPTLHVAAFFAVISAVIGVLGYQDNREGHAWCDAAPLIRAGSVSDCMKAWNRGGAAEVRRHLHDACAADQVCSADW